MTTAADPRRASLIKLIHVARRDLERSGRMDEPTYRTMLRSAGGADSTTKMDVPALLRVLEQAKRAGFQVRSKVSDRSLDTKPQARKARALWLFLHQLGVVKDPSEAALAKYVKRIAQVDDMHWANGWKMDRLIETMKKWAMRFLPQVVAELQVQVFHRRQAGNLTPEQEDNARRCISRLRDLKGFDVHWEAWAVFSLLVGRSVPEEIAIELGRRA